MRTSRGWASMSEPLLSGQSGRAQLASMVAKAPRVFESAEGIITPLTREEMAEADALLTAALAALTGKGPGS